MLEFDIVEVDFDQCDDVEMDVLDWEMMESDSEERWADECTSKI